MCTLSIIVLLLSMRRFTSFVLGNIWWILYNMHVNDYKQYHSLVVSWWFLESGSTVPLKELVCSPKINCVIFESQIPKDLKLVWKVLHSQIEVQWKYNDQLSTPTIDGPIIQIFDKWTLRDMGQIIQILDKWIIVEMVHNHLSNTATQKGPG